MSSPQPEKPVPAPRDSGSLVRKADYQHPQDRNGIDWITGAQQGGGKVPEDFAWNSNPKQEQEDG